jgi:hypothetical protein
LTYETKYTFSSLMRLLIENERKLEELYERAAKATNDPELRILLSNSSKKGLKRIERMRTARVETVVEIALEPITDLILNDLLATINSTIGNAGLSDLEKTQALERTTSELYSRTSPKISQISAETGELLNAFANESKERLLELEQYVKSAYPQEQ